MKNTLRFLIHLTRLCTIQLYKKIMKSLHGENDIKTEKQLTEKRVFFRRDWEEFKKQ